MGLSRYRDVRLFVSDAQLATSIDLASFFTAIRLAPEQRDFWTFETGCQGRRVRTKRLVQGNSESPAVAQALLMTVFGELEEHIVRTQELPMSHSGVDDNGDDESTSGASQDSDDTCTSTGTMALRLPKLPSVRDLTRIYNLRAKQQLSQNFLMDANITNKIISMAGLELDNALCVEVGPGPGLLTRSLLNGGARSVVAVEKDPRFRPILDQLQDASAGRFRAVVGDMLTIDHAEITGCGRALGGRDAAAAFDSVHLVGNLPFSVATPLLIQWLHMLAQRRGIFASPQVSMTLMFQKEVGDRITAGHSEGARGRLSVVAQSLCDAFRIYSVPAAAFVPRPKVDAVVVQLRPLDAPLLRSSLTTLEHLTRMLFMKRRKMLARIVKDWDPAHLALLDECDIDPTLRPQDVPTERLCRLAQVIEERAIRLP